MQECNLITSLGVINFRITKDRFIWLLILELIKICNKEQPSLSKKKKKKKNRCDMSQTKTVVADNTTPADNRAENEFHDS
jgi:hypothetical protein